MNKKLLAVFSLLASLTLFAACGGGETPSGSTGSTGGDTPSESVGGDEECVHTGGTATCTQKAVCDECGEEYGELAAHDYSVVQSDEDSHWNKCANCDATEGDTAHVAGTEVKYDATNHWVECECGYKMNVTAHEIVGGSDAEKHWGACDCGYATEGEAHVYNVEKSDDTYHWNECVCGAIDESSKAAHDYATVKYDETNHWNECSCGAKSGVTAHTASEQWSATHEGHWKDCEGCDYKFEEGAHEAESEWNFDDEKHWKNCANCGWGVIEAEHNYVGSLVDNQYKLACECGKEIALEDSIAYFDRLNKNLVQADGRVKFNNANYWDGDASIVTVAKQDSIVKLSYNFSALTTEQLAAADAGWSGWSADKSMWVGYAIPVNGLDLTDFELILDAKMDNMNTKITVYAAQDYEGALEAVYEVGAESYFDVADAQDLGDGWYRYTMTINCENGVGEAADYIILSLDNTAAGIDKAQESIAYIDNVSLKKIIYYTVTANGVEETVREGSTYTPAIPEKDGYKFIGWVDADGNAVETPITVNGDITLEATWEKLPIQAKLYMNVGIDLAESIEAKRYYEIVSFSGGAGTYNLSVNGGIKVYPLVNGAFDITNPGEELTKLVFADETTENFAVTYAYDEEAGELNTVGSIMITLDNATVRYSIWRDDKYALSASTEEPAPLGFTQVSEFNWLNNTTLVDEKVNNVPTGNKIPWASNLLDFPAFIVDTSMDISKYTDLYYAIKSTNSKGFYVRGCSMNFYATTNWVYVHYSKAEDGKWSLSISAEGMPTYENVQSNITATNLQKLMEYNGSNGTIGTGFYASRNAVTEEAMLYMTEVVGIKEPQPPFDPGISTDAKKIVESAIVDNSGNEHLTPANNAAGVAVPYGFNQVTNFFSASGNTWFSRILSSGDFAGQMLTPFSEVWFAIAIQGGHFTNTADNWKQLDADSALVWFNFHLTQTAANTWTVEIYVDGELYNTFTGKPGDTIYKILENNNNGLRLVIYQQNDGNQSTADVNIYATEVVGVEKPADPFSPDIPEEAVKVRDSIWRANNWALAETDEAAPTGFTMVEMFDWNGNTANPGGANWGGSNKDMSLTCLDEAVVSIYSAVYFAMKMSGGTGFYIRGAQKYEGSAWLYFYLVKQADGTWNLSLRSDDGAYEAIDVQTGLVGDNLQVLLQYSATNGAKGSGCYPTKADGDTTSQVYVYMTDMRAIEEPFDPQISEKAVALSSTVLKLQTTSNVQVIEDCSTVEKANGFKNVYGIQNVNWKSSNFPENEYNQAANVSAYSELWFALKLYNAKLVFVQLSKADIAGDANGTDWIYFHATKNADATWTTEVTYKNAVYATATNQVASTLEDLLYDGGYGTTDGGAFVLYQYSGTDIKIYTTEVMGVFQTGISENAVNVWDHIWNPYYFTGGGQPEGAYSEEAAPAGFDKVSEYTWTKGGDFPVTGHFNNSDISAYSDLWFAIKAKNAKVYVQGATAYTGGGWLYVHYHQNDDGTWTKDYRSADGYFNNTSQVSGNITGTKLTEMISWKEGVNQGSYPNEAVVDVEATGYFTNVIGVLKA